MTECAGNFGRINAIEQLESILFLISDNPQPAECAALAEAR